ncbi:Arm DNA-binding domain-containing protein [Halorhodospira halochloris]|uniref:Arm DNA-binding domain-containing protein n=1 Tax=Halorhodospira halochloris TaxID=1052 RepID=UPI001EE7B193|nr:DUF3596 domain-containing protein [Halorhodospira halochloris]MCG5549482.1 DUF3596 domain-containing protein [Halorhodospira halochloris]
MASFCVRPNGILQYDLCLYGRRFRESSGLQDTPDNRRRIRRDLRRINAEIEMGTFDYAAWDGAMKPPGMDSRRPPHRGGWWRRRSF